MFRLFVSDCLYCLYWIVYIVILFTLDCLYFYIAYIIILDVFCCLYWIAYCLYWISYWILYCYILYLTAEDGEQPNWWLEPCNQVQVKEVNFDCLCKCRGRRAAKLLAAAMKPRWSKEQRFLFSDWSSSF